MKHGSSTLLRTLVKFGERVTGSSTKINFLLSSSVMRQRR